MIDNYLADIEKIQSDGGIVVIKWDGERVQLRHTVVVSRNDTDFVWHKDSDDICSALGEALKAYKAAHMD